MLDLDVLAEEIAAIVKDQIALAVAPLAAANTALSARLAVAEGRAAGLDEAAVKRLIAEAVAGLPAPRDGTSVTIADVEPILVAAVERAVAELPVPQDGASVTIADVEPLIASAVAALPVPADGKSVTVDDLGPVVDAAVARAVAALPVAKDGVGLAGAMIDRTGALVVTLSDGKLCELGPVEGKDGEPGLGFDDMSIEQTSERGITLRFARGGQVKTFELIVPAVIDRGVFKDGQAYTAGDAVTYGGSLWIAQKDTGQKPDGPDTGWRLAVKKGRDGRDLTRD
jgi:hypothetical protein